MKRNYYSAFTLAILMLLLASSVYAVPKQVNYQGRLTDGSGIPVPDGTHSARFSLWTDSTSGMGTEVWFENQSITTAGGLFSTILGRVSSFFDIWTEYAQSGLYLEVQVTVGGVSSTLSPRTPMIASPYSVTAGEVRGEVSSGMSRAKGIVKGTGSGYTILLEADLDGDGLAESMLADSVSPGQVSRLSGQDIDGNGGLDRKIGMVCNNSGATILATGDPDFDLLRIQASADSAKIRISGKSSGDPDFDLLRISGGGGGGGGAGGEIRITGDPDFDLLRLQAGTDSATIRISGQIMGDPDFDLLRISGGGGGGVNAGGEIVITGDPDFDLLTIQAGTDSAAISLRADSDADGLSDNSITSVSNAIGARTIWIGRSGGSTTGTIRMAATPDSIASVHVADLDGDGAADRSIENYCDNDKALCAIKAGDDQTPASVTWMVDAEGPSIAIGEEGVQRCLMSPDSGLQISDASSNKTVDLDSDGYGYLAGNLGIGVSNPTQRIEVIGGAYCNGTQWVNFSDANSKENYRAVDGKELLEKIRKLRIFRWNYKTQSDEITHIGPTAQDFHKQFGVGDNDKSISTIDPAGIALAAIQELYKTQLELSRRSARVDELEKKIQELQDAIEKLQKVVK